MVYGVFRAVGSFWYVFVIQYEQIWESLIECKHHKVCLISDIKSHGSVARVWEEMRRGES